MIYTFLEAGIISIFNSDCPSKLYRLEAVYRGIKKKEAKTTRTRLPIALEYFRPKLIWQCVAK
jgi:hypothetical protein